MQTPPTYSLSARVQIQNDQKHMLFPGTFLHLGMHYECMYILRDHIAQPEQLSISPVWSFQLK